MIETCKQFPLRLVDSLATQWSCCLDGTLWLLLCSVWPNRTMLPWHLNAAILHNQLCWATWVLCRENSLVSFFHAPNRCSPAQRRILKNKLRHASMLWFRNYLNTHQLSFLTIETYAAIPSSARIFGKASRKVFANPGWVWIRTLLASSGHKAKSAMNSAEALAARYKEVRHKYVFSYKTMYVLCANKIFIS